MKRLLVLAALASTFACASPAPEPQKPAAPAEVPITSKSAEAIEHFKKGRDLAENVRLAEADKEFDQALKLDPDFVMAMVYKANGTFRPEGTVLLEQANAKAASLSKPEQLVVAATLAGRQNDFSKAEELWKEAAAAVPTDWRVHLALGTQLFVAQKYGETVEAMNKAVAINPNAGIAYNIIGYSYLFQGESAPAVEALKKYASLAPNEPNPQDSLGEALMADGKFADAEAAFRKAIAMSPGFSISWDGVAYAKFFAGDWAGGREAVAQERAAATRRGDRTAADRLGAFGALAEGKTAEGLKRLEAIDKSTDASLIDAAFTPVNRAMVEVETGKYREAVADTEAALSIANGGTLPVGNASILRGVALPVMSVAQGRMGDAPGVERSVAALQQASAAAPNDPTLKSAVHLAQGMLALAKKDLKGAAAHFAMCSQQDSYCQWQAFEAAHKAGDTTAAAAALARLTKVYRRDPVYLYARSTVARMTSKGTN